MKEKVMALPIKSSLFASLCKTWITTAKLVAQNLGISARISELALCIALLLHYCIDDVFVNDKIRIGQVAAILATDDHHQVKTGDHCQDLPA
jgi:hypothetical protein